MDPLLPALIVAILVSLSCGIMYRGWRQLRTTETAQQRLERLTRSPRPLEQAELERPLSDRLLKPWLRQQIQAVGRLAPSRNIQKLQQNLVSAGYPYGLSVLDFLGLKLLASVLAGIATVYIHVLRNGRFFQTAFLTAGAMAIAFMLPDFWLGSRVRQRQAEILRSLPDALDMLTICVDAGAGLESAMLRLSQKWQNAAAAEFGKVVAEIRLGMTRRTALQNMVARTAVPEVGSFVAVLLQADQFGLSIAKVLHMQSDQMRARRWQRAEEKARKVAIKMLFPLVFLIMPAMFAVTVGPAIPALIKTFAGMRGR